MKSVIWAAQVLAVLLLGAVLYGYQGRAIEKTVIAEVSAHLVKEARLCAELSMSQIKDLRQDAPAVVGSIGNILKARATIVASDGAVMGDSEIPAVRLDTLDNHGGRQEVQAALLTGQGESVRYSETLRTDMLYEAVRFRSGAGETAVLRLALPLPAQVEEFAPRAVLFCSLALALLLILANYRLHTRTERSLRELAAVAERFGKGMPVTRLAVENGSALGRLSAVLNEVAVRIDGELARTKAERNRLNAILSGMGEGIMVADVSGSITLVNPAFKSLFEPGEEVEGRQLIDISRHPALHDTFRQVLASKAERVEELLLRTSGEKTVLTHWVPLMEGGTLQGVVVVFHDISEIRRLENIRKDFVANVSHELRTPITVIKGYAETLMAGALESNPEQALRFVSIIVSHAERLGALVADLLTLSQLESGKLSLEARSVDVPELAGHVASLLEQKSEEKGIRVELAGLDAAPLILADPGRLEQVLLNLLDNAIKYTPAGGSISMSAELEGNLVRIGVHDTGIGIPSRDLPRIFERFYRVDTARSREEGGTGLGLSIVKHLVQLQGGTVSVQSSGRGSSFFFTVRRLLETAKLKDLGSRPS